MAGDRVYSTRETVAISSCVWGYHVYKDRWKPRIGENLACVRESTILKTAMLCDTVAVVKPRPRGRNRERCQATLWIRQHNYECADAWSISRSTSPQLVHVATGEGNVRYYYFCVSSNFRRFHFRHAVAVRKLNPFENNRLYGIKQLGVTTRWLQGYHSKPAITRERQHFIKIHESIRGRDIFTWRHCSCLSCGVEVNTLPDDRMNDTQNEQMFETLGCL